MTHGGNSLTDWIKQIKDTEKRVNFASEFLRQSIKALQVLHSLGYSHGDLKPENICARQTQHGKFKFTLIDFGICQKLAKFSDSSINQYFKGNLMFASQR